MKLEKFYSLVNTVVILMLLILPRMAESRISSSTKHLDRYLNLKFKEKKLKPSPQTQDEVFLRRVYLDLTGKIPTTDEILAFKNGGRNKRTRKISELLNSDAYLDYWSDIWTSWLIGQEQNNQRDIQEGLQTWVRAQLTNNTPYDEFVLRLINATGDTRQNGASYYIRHYNASPIDLTDHISRLFLGLPMHCVCLLYTSPSPRD